MPKLYRIVSYLVDIHENFPDKQDLIDTIKNHKYLSGIDVRDVQETDCGKWADDHELNYLNAPYEKYFPDVENSGPSDINLKNEFRKYRSEMLKVLDELKAVKLERNEFKKQNEGLQKVKEFVKTINQLNCGF